MRSAGWSTAVIAGATAAALAAPVSSPAVAGRHAAAHRPPVAQRHEFSQAGGGADNSRFGVAVAVAGDTMVVGQSAYSNDLGRVFVYQRPASGWAHARLVATLTASDGQGNGSNAPCFGCAVAMDGDTIVVAANAQTVGSTSNEGEVYVFVRPKSGWSGTRHENARLTLKARGNSDELGYDGVAVSGATIVAATPYRTVANTPGSGGAFVFTRPAHGWTGSLHETGSLLPPASSDAGSFGAGGVGVSGGVIAVGSPYESSVGTPTVDAAGAVFVYRRPSAGWTGSHLPVARLVASDPQDSDEIGNGTGLAVLGGTIVSASYDHSTGSGNDDNQGEGYVWVEPKAGWHGTRTQSARLLGPVAVNSANLGRGLGLSGTDVVLDAPLQPVGSNDAQGVAYLFRRPSAGWSGTVHPVSAFTAKDGQSSDYFGENSVAVSGTTVVAGTVKHKVNSVNPQGTAYVFAPPRPVLSGLKQSHKVWRKRAHAPVLDPKRAPIGGTRFSFTLSQDSLVAVVFAHPAKHGKTVRRFLVLGARAGKHRLYFFGRVKHQAAFPVGKYSATFAASNSAGVSVPHSLHFKLRAAKH